MKITRQFLISVIILVLAIFLGWVFLKSLRPDLVTFTFSVFTALVVVYLKETFFVPGIIVQFEKDKAPFVGEFYSFRENVHKKYLRIRIVNEGWTTAKNCEAKLVVKDRDGKELLDPTVLHWARYFSEPSMKPLHIRRKEREILDVAYTKRGDNDIYFETDRTRYAREQNKPIFYDKKPPGQYLLTITIYSDNGEPESRNFILAWDGTDYRTVTMDWAPH